MKTLRENKPLLIYFIIISLTALAMSMSNDILSNYFKDAYNVSAVQRGLIELPRELPGALLIFTVFLLSFLSDIRMAMVSQVLSVIGIIALGIFTPSFNVMLVFIFINSMGMHLFFPLQDSIGLSMVDQDNIGRRMGQFKGVTTAFLMIGYGIVFVGFRSGIFSFTSNIKWVFIIVGILLSIVFILFIYLERHLGHSPTSGHKFTFIFRKEYKYYYILVTMYGVQKQMMMVYGPWVLIEILGKGPDTMAVLGMIGAFIGVFFMPAVGRWIDQFGVKTLLFADAISFIFVYGVYGFMSGGLSDGWLSKMGWPVIFMFVLYIVDRMSTQLGMVRSIYLKTILVEETDLTPTLSLGISLDHVMSITFAVLGGLVWKAWGPQYIFYLVALLSFVNLYIAFKVEPSNSLT